MQKSQNGTRLQFVMVVLNSDVHDSAVSFRLDKLKGSAELLENFHQILFKSKGKVKDF